jgi:hypothetical protein
MKIKLAVQVAMLLFPLGSMAATVEYQHPQVTIVAVDESLDSVLKTLGREMQLNVTTPPGINPVINCDIQNQPIRLAFKNLLGELSYSLVWADDGQRLTGLIILAGDGESAEVAGSERQSSGASNNIQVASVQVATDNRQSADAPTSRSDDNPQMAEHEAQMESKRQEHDARMAEERETQEAEMAQRREEQEIAHKVHMKEERARREADIATLAASLGLPPPPQ